jgi:hypothetical protein
MAEQAPTDASVQPGGWAEQAFCSNRSSMDWKKQAAC